MEALGGIKQACRLADLLCMLALSIRQPYAELILRGVKTIEYRSRPTKLVGKRFYIYASRQWATGNGQWGTTGIGEWAMVNGKAIANCPFPIAPGSLPTGVIVGSAVISHCTNGTPGQYQWHLKDVRRYKKQRKVKRQPQPVWFVPW